MSEGITANQLESGVVRILPHTEVFNNDQIKALGSGGNDAVIVPAQGPNKIIHLLRGSGILDTTGGGYTNMVAGSGWALFTDANAGVYASCVIPIMVVAGIAGIRPLIFSAHVAGSPDMLGEDDLAGVLITEAPSTTPANKPLVISDWFGNGAYGGGHADNTLQVTVAYMVQDIVTGEFG